MLFESVAVLQGNISLVNTSGVNGGGMALLSNSYILLDSSTTLQLLNNKAEGFGGGIYVSSDLVEFVLNMMVFFAHFFLLCG